MKKMFFTVIMIIAIAFSIAGCASAADVASNNLSTSADNFQIERRIVFYNGITGDYILEIEGLCSLGNNDPAGELSVTCKTGPDQYKKHFLGLSDNVTYFAEQIDPATVDSYHYIVLFRPEEIIPDINVKTSGGSQTIK
jgi:ABC-type Fe3+-hydroxamate transport system substrate-binding protein